MLRKYKPVTPGQRFKVRLIKPKKDSNLYKNLVREGRIKYRKASRGGRNQTGRITVRGRGNIEKRRVRVLDYKREKGQHSLGITSTLRYNPSISATMAIIESGGDSKRR
jgi:large subunit ribosomal protein L2